MASEGLEYTDDYIIVHSFPFLKEFESYELIVLV